MQLDNPSEEIDNDEAPDAVNDDPDNPQGNDEREPDAERMKAQLKGSREEGSFLNTVLRVAAKPELILDMDRGEAEKIIKRLHKEGLATTTDYDEVVESIRPSASKGAKKKGDDGWSDKESIVQEAMKRLRQEQARERTEAAVAKALKGHDADSREKILAEFREVSDGRNWTTERAMRELDKIVNYYRKDDAKTDAYARMANVPKGKSSPWSDTDAADRRYYENLVGVYGSKEAARRQPALAEKFGKK